MAGEILPEALRVLRFDEEVELTRDRAIELLNEAGVPCGPIYAIDQMFADPQVLARGLQIGLTREDGVQVPGVANPILFSETPVEYEKAPPKLGDGTESVLKNLIKLSDEQIKSLLASGIVA
jgi:crotonobetainyl-CoA:carnitine CoA-transferase CaiB-like acyl-CoA transferase